MSTNVTMAAEIGARLRAERQRCALTQQQLADLTRVSKTSQVNYESGSRTPDGIYFAHAASAGIDVAFVITGVSASVSTADDFAWIPLLPATASAGHGALNEPDAEYTSAGLCFSRRWLAAKRLPVQSLRVIEVRGASMEGVLSDGDHVLIDLSDTNPRSGFVYVIRQGEELLVKYCQLLPGGLLRVSSANPAYQAYDVDLATTADVQIVGRVVASMHEW